MKRSDIDDDHVIELARAWQEGSDALLRGTLHGPRPPGVLDALVAEGIPVKVAYAKILHLSERGLLDYGTSARYAWPT